MDTTTAAAPQPTPAEAIDVTAARPLRCIVEGCPGSPFAEYGYHLVGAIKTDDSPPVKKPKGLSAAAAFCCTTHLPQVEEAVAAYCRTHAAEEWAVQTYRMQGWQDDGRGTCYVSATGPAVVVGETDDPNALF